MAILDNILIKDITDDVQDFKVRNKNSGYVEADYSSGVVVLRPTKQKERNIDTRTISKLF